MQQPGTSADARVGLVESQIDNRSSKLGNPDRYKPEAVRHQHLESAFSWNE